VPSGVVVGKPGRATIDRVVINAPAIEFGLDLLEYCAVDAAELLVGERLDAVGRKVAAA
jgi:hypothetical protein